MLFIAIDVSTSLNDNYMILDDIFIKMQIHMIRLIESIKCSNLDCALPPLVLDNIIHRKMLIVHDYLRNVLHNDNVLKCEWESYSIDGFN